MVRTCASAKSAEISNLLVEKQTVLELGLHGSFRVGVIDGLVDAEKPEEVILHNAQVKKNAVCMPSNTADHRSCNGVQDEVVGGGNNGGKDESRVGHAYNNNSNVLPGVGSKATDGESSQSGEKAWQLLVVS
jgi:hypothetical protein